MRLASLPAFVCPACCISAFHELASALFCSSLNVPSGYAFNDGLGHVYNANICGYSSQMCLPSWSTTVQFGSAVRSWGDVPACNATYPACVNPMTGKAVCCSADCEVLGTGSPVFSLLNATKPEAGLNVSFMPVAHSESDPFWCPWNPTIGAQYPWSVQYSIQCDESVTGAVPLLALENKTMSCDFLLTFASKLACPTIASPSASPSPSVTPSVSSSNSPTPSTTPAVGTVRCSTPLPS